RRLLPLELVDRADPGTGRQNMRQEIDLRIVGRDHQDVGRTDRVLVAVSILIRLADQASIDIENGPPFLGARLAVPGMGNRRKAQAGWHQWWARAGKEQPLAGRGLVAAESTVVDHTRDVIADKRMETPGDWQEDAAIGRYRGEAIEQIGQGRTARVAGMYTLN